MRTLFLSAALLVGCSPNQLAPDAVSADPELQVNTGGLWQGPVGVRIQGIARGVNDVTVNGRPVAVDGDQYTVDVPLDRGVNLVEARGTDDRGDTHFVRQGVLAGDFGSPADSIESALTIRVNRSGLTKAMEGVAGLIDAVAINESVAGINPVYSDTYGVFGWDAVEIEADIVSIDFMPMVITSDPKPGVLEIEVLIPYVEVAANATGDVVGIDFDQDAWVGADAAIITANLLVDTENGQLAVALVAPTVVLEGFWYDTSLLPGDVEDYLFVDTIRGAIEGMLLEKIEEMVPPLLESSLSGLDISVDTELLGRQVSMAATFSSATIDGSGIQIGADIELGIPGDTAHEWVGYLTSPVLNAQPSMADDLGVSMSDNLVNNLLFQAWRSSILILDLDSARGELDPIFLSSLGAVDAARVVLDAKLPPVLVERNNRAQVQISELEILIETPGGTSGEFLVLSVTAFVDIDLAIENNVLVLQLGSDPEVVVDVRDSDWGASNQSVTNVLAEQLPIGVLLALLGDIEFPLPSLAGLNINQAQAVREANGVHTSIGINL